MLKKSLLKVILQHKSSSKISIRVPARSKRTTALLNISGGTPCIRRISSAEPTKSLYDATREEKFGMTAFTSARIASTIGKEVVV